MYKCIFKKNKQNQTLNLSLIISITEVTSGGNNTCVVKIFIWLSSLIVLPHIWICWSATKGME